jgi:hypothetical protein
VVVGTVAAMTTSSPHAARACISFRLDADWARLRTHRRALTQARTWRGDRTADPLGALVADLDDLDAIVRSTQRGAADGDAILRRLVEVARTGDELAGRVLIQRLLPGLIARAVPYRGFRDDLDPVELVVAAAWEAIHAFDTERRRREIAASLISDAVFKAFRAPLRRMAATEEIRDPQRFIETIDTAPARTPVEVLADVVVAARCAGVPTADLDLIRRLVQVESPNLIAAERQVTARTIRNHRDRAVRRIRAAIAA